MIGNGVPHAIEEAVQRLLDGTSQAKSFGLRVFPEATRTEDDWVYIVIVPTKPGIRAADFVDVLGSVEAQVRSQQGKQEILLVPAAN